MEQSRPLTFLDLPEHIRRSIYALSGLVRECPIELSFRRLQPHPKSACRFTQLRGIAPGPGRPEDSFLLCSCPRLPLDLTLVSRRVREEALDVLLGANLFVARERRVGTNTLVLATRERRRHKGQIMQVPSPLGRIPTVHLARMTRLVIRLNCCPCPKGGHEMVVRMRDMSGSEVTLPPRRACSDNGYKPALSGSGPDNQRIIESWKDLCRRLGSGREPGRTDLTLICDVDSTANASLIVEPLKAYLPSLRSCTIRLGPRSADRSLRTMARDSALFLTKGQPSQRTKPFPFGRLPRELKMLVLSYTHLGPPELAGYKHDFTQVNIINGRFRYGDIRHGINKMEERCCGVCTDTLRDCCCLNEHASFAPRCACRVLPMPLFLVDRDTRLTALQTFYPTARFALRHHEISDVFNFLPNTIFPLLRNITLALNPAQCCHWNGDKNVDVLLSRQAPRYTKPLRHAFKTIMTTLAAASTTPVALEINLHPFYVFPAQSLTNIYRFYTNTGLTAMGLRYEEVFRWIYDLFRDVAAVIREAFSSETSRRALSSVKFRLPLFRNLEGWLEREVLGDRFRGVVKQEGSGEYLIDRMPAYHQA